jgi:hypothetical protein
MVDWSVLDLRDTPYGKASSDCLDGTLHLERNHQRIEKQLIQPGATLAMPDAQVHLRRHPVAC